MERVKLIFNPVWEGSVYESYAMKYISKNVWRTLPEHDFDDLYQIAWMEFQKCLDCYPHVIEAKHLMYMWKLWMFSTITDLSNVRTKRKESKPVVALENGEVPLVEYLAGNTETSDDRAYISMMIEDAPPIIRKLLDAVKAETSKTKYKRLGRGIRETTNQRLCRLVNADSDRVDMLGLINRWLEGKAIA